MTIGPKPDREDVSEMAGSFTHMHIVARSLRLLPDDSILKQMIQRHPRIANFGSIFPDEFYYGDTKTFPDIAQFTDLLHKTKNTSFVLKLFEQLHEGNGAATDNAKERRVVFAATTLTHIAGDIIVHPEVDAWLERYSKELDPRDKNGDPLKMDYCDNYIPHSQCELTHDCYVYRTYNEQTYAIEKKLDPDLESFIAEGYRRTYPDHAPPTTTQQQSSYKRLRIAIRYLAFCNGRIALPPYFYSRGRNFPFSLRRARERLFLDGFEAVIDRAAERAAAFLRIIERFHTGATSSVDALEQIGEWGLDHGTKKELDGHYRALFTD